MQCHPLPARYRNRVGRGSAGFQPAMALTLLLGITQVGDIIGYLSRIGQQPNGDMRP